jgi:hypothetical protein
VSPLHFPEYEESEDVAEQAGLTVPGKYEAEPEYREEDKTRQNRKEVKKRC